MPDLLLTALAGVGVGFLSGVFGLGGGFLVVPVLHVLLGKPIHISVGAGACQVLGPATASLLARRPRREHFRVPAMIAGGQIIGTIAGVATLTAARDSETGSEITIAGNALPALDVMVLALYLAILSSIGVFAIWETGRGLTGAERRGWLARIPIPPYCTTNEFGDRRVSIPVLTWFGLTVGFFGGLLGMSGGLMVLPGLIYLMGMHTQQAVRSSLVIVWIGAVPSTIAHAWAGNIDLQIVAALLVGGTVGARLGSQVGERLAGPKLRRCFGWLLLATAGMVAARLVGVL
ncbi:MAG: sulfite exporter TauE/SafE family protein [Planctomycetaceae bacterium]